MYYIITYPMDLVLNDLLLFSLREMDLYLMEWYQSSYQALSESRFLLLLCHMQIAYHHQDDPQCVFMLYMMVGIHQLRSLVDQVKMAMMMKNLRSVLV